MGDSLSYLDNLKKNYFFCVIFFVCFKDCSFLYTTVHTYSSFSFI